MDFLCGYARCLHDFSRFVPGLTQNNRQQSKNNMTNSDNKCIDIKNKHANSRNKCINIKNKQARSRNRCEQSKNR